jgi:hypothetical protein
MPTQFASIASQNPSTDQEAYIYKIVPVANGFLAGITSADEAFLLDASSLGRSQPVYVPSPPKQLTSLVALDGGQGIAVGGGGGGAGTVQIYDVRSRLPVVDIQVGEYNHYTLVIHFRPMKDCSPGERRSLLNDGQDLG